METEIHIAGQGLLDPFITHENTRVHFATDVPILFIEGEGECFLIYIALDKTLWFYKDGETLWIRTCAREDMEPIKIFMPEAAQFFAPRPSYV